MIRELTCIVCPRGCNLKVEFDGKEVTNVEGNFCPRGKEYAVNEMTNPVRTVTSTVRLKNGEVLPVKTALPIPKSKIFECMAEINKVVADLPISSGDVIIENTAGTKVSVIATKSAK